MDPTLPAINNKVAPMKVGQGYVWLVSFALPRPAQQDGWIVQEVFKSRSRTVVNPKEHSVHYWEAWPVAKFATSSPLKQTVAQHLLALGYTQAEISILQNIPFINSSANDAFADLMAIPGSKGSVTVIATARFYPVVLPPDFVPNHPRTQAGVLRSTIQRPGFWTGEGTYRFVADTWDFTGATPKHDLTTKRKDCWKVFGGAGTPAHRPTPVGHQKQPHHANAFQHGAVSPSHVASFRTPGTYGVA